MAGLFGGARSFLDRQRGQGNLAERLQMFGASMQDIGQLDGVDRAGTLRTQAAARQAAATRATAQTNLNRGLFGGGQPTQTLDLQDLAQGGQGRVIDQPAPPAQQGLPSLREAGPALIAAQQAGIDIGDYVSLLDRAGPDVAYEQGFRYDRRDPNSAPVYAPNLGEGQAPTIRNGQVQSVQNLPGYVESLAVRERNVNDARNASDASYAGVQAENTARGTGRGSAPYDVMTVQGPDGRPITTSRENILGSGPIYGQSEADKAYATTSATNLAAREDAAETRGSAAERLLPSLDRMEALLPDVIAGIGADQRLMASRALAATGNAQAVRESTATQVFQNEARQVVAQVIRSFGANPTEGERKYAEQMSGADVNYTPQALAEGIRLARARAERDRASAPSQQGSAGGQVAYDGQGNRYVVRNGQWVRE